jgi:alpha-tubulin suppressor-like RCC1 family protein
MRTVCDSSWLVGLCALLVACGDDAPVGGSGGEGGSGAQGGGGAATGGEGGAPAVPVGEVRVEVVDFCSNCSELWEGTSRQFRARVFSPSGVELEVEVDWSTTPVTVLAVDDAGLVTGVAAGSADLVATAGSVSGTFTMTVLPSPIVSIELTPAEVTHGAIGESTTFTAVATNALGVTVPNPPLTWIGSNSVLGSVDPRGTFTGAERGHTLVLATDGFATGWAEVVIGEVLSPRSAWTTGALSLGGTHGCGVDGEALSCWGWNFFGQLGNGENLDGFEPVPVPVAGDEPWASVTTGLYHACGLTTGGLARCWGSGPTGELGTGDETVLGSAIPVAVAGDHVFTQLSAGGSHTCGLTASGALYCWGAGITGAVGDGTLVSRFAPVEIAAGSTFRDVATSLWATCAVKTDGAVLCWGTNELGELGDGSDLATKRASPGPVAGGHTLVSLDAYASHFCGLTAELALVCWGRNDTGQIGDGAAQHALVPVVVDPGPFLDVTTGAHHTCALSATGLASCWGDGSYGQLGGGRLEGSTSPVAVLGGLAFASIEAGSHATCARTAAGETYCWGNSDLGQLGGGLGGPGAMSAVPWPMSAP